MPILKSNRRKVETYDAEDAGVIKLLDEEDKAKMVSFNSPPFVFSVIFVSVTLYLWGHRQHHFI